MDETSIDLKERRTKGKDNQGVKKNDIEKQKDFLNY